MNLFNSPKINKITELFKKIVLSFGMVNFLHYKCDFHYFSEIF